MKTKNILLIDGNSLMHRSYHGVSKGFVPFYNGQPIGMVYGFAAAFLNAIDFLRPNNIFVTFDTKEKTFRHKMDENYKAHRKKAPDDFYPQVPFILEMLESFSTPALRLPGYESDDIIGTVSRKLEKEGDDVCILSSDLDFLQLVGEKIKLLRLNGKIDQSPQFGKEETYEKMGVFPNQVVDFKALAGDSSDNYKGVVGLGPKTASRFLDEFKTLDGVYENIEKIQEKWRVKLLESKEYVYHCQALAQIALDVPISFSLEREFKFTPEKTIPFFQRLGMRGLEMRYQKMYTNSKSGGWFDIEKKITSQKTVSVQTSLF